MAEENIVAIIPARGGSKGLLRKNVRPLGGKPLLAWTIEAATQAESLDRVIVSTDDHEISRIAQAYGAEVPFVRPPELALDDAPTEPVLRHAVLWLSQHEGYDVDIVVFLQPTDIFRPEGIVDQVVRRLLANPELDSVFSAYATHKNFWRRSDGRYKRLAPDIEYGPRQTREHLYREDTGIACATRAKWIERGRRLGDYVDVVVTHEQVTYVDIHDHFTFWLAEQILKSRWYPDCLDSAEDVPQ